MSKVNFDFNPWKDESDILLDNPSNTAAYAMVNGGFALADTPSKRARVRDRHVDTTVNGVVELLAGCIELLREFGMSPTELENAVKSFTKKNKDKASQKIEASTRKESELLADGHNIEHRLDPDKVIC